MEPTEPMRREPDRDSLDTIELVMALEEKGLELEVDIDDLTDISSEEAELLVDIACLPYEAHWRAPQSDEAWPSTVRVLGERERTVLFVIGLHDRFGVGCRRANGVIDDARVYPSFRRALFAAPRHSC